MKSTERLSKGLIYSASLMALTLGYSQAAFAQDAAEPAEATPPSVNGATENTGLEDIVVTAQRRKESAQKVPIAIQTLNEVQLQQIGVANTNDLPLAVPGFQISSSAVNQLYYLRGVGSQQVGVGTSAAVATFVDGVYMPFTASALQGFNNIQSVEVDKGPQGTLFGRNATGGVIQINTKDPKFEFAADATASFANYAHPSGNIYVTGGLTDNIAADLALLADRQGEGWGKSLATGKDIFKRSIYGARTKVLFNLSDATTLRLSADVSRVTGDHGSAYGPAIGVGIWDIATGTQLPNPGRFNSWQNTAADHKTTDYGGSIKLNSDLGFAQFLSVSAYRAYRTTLNVDFDGGPSTFLPVLNKQREKSFTQELQLSSSDNTDFIWTAGLFYLTQRGHIDPFRFGAPFASVALPFGVPLGDTYDLTGKTKTASYAAYAQITATILPNTHLTLGGRYTYDVRHIEGYGQAVGPVAPAPFIIPFTVGDQKATFKKPTFRIGFDHDFSPTIKVYATFNRGFQSGTFNANNATGYSETFNPALQPENIDAYEAGIKSELFDRRLRINASAFYYDYSNLQQQTYVGGALQTLNAGGAKIKGVDLEVRFQPTSSLSVGFVGEYLDAKFKDYLNAPGYSYPMGFGVGPLVPTPIANAKGNRLTFAPKYTGTIFVNHTLDTSLGKFITSGTFVYNDGVYVDPGNLYKQPHYQVFNLTEEWVANENVSVSFWMKNIFDKRYDQSIAAVGGTGFVANTPGAPREYGITMRYHF